RVDHLDQVVRDEPATVPGPSAAAAQVVLQQRERAGKADKLDQRAVHHRREMQPCDPGPAPGEKNAAHDKADEQQMDDNHEISGNVVPHLGSTGRPACTGRDATGRLACTGRPAATGRHAGSQDKRTSPGAGSRRRGAAPAAGLARRLLTAIVAGLLTATVAGALNAPAGGGPASPGGRP